MKITIIILAWIILWQFWKYNVRYVKMRKRLKRLNTDFRIPFDDYTRILSKSVEYYHYLVDLRDNSGQHEKPVINKLLLEYDKMIFDKEEGINPGNLSVCPFCKKETKFKQENDVFICSNCKAKI